MQVDFVSLVLTNSIVGNLDIDLLALRTPQPGKMTHTLGTRFGASTVRADGGHAGMHLSQDVDLLLRASSRYEKFILDLCIGPSFATTNNVVGRTLKAGVDFRYILFPYMGLDAKISASGMSHNIGLGVSVGYFASSP